MIYFVQAGENGPVKIGWAKNVIHRIQELQTGNPCKLGCLGMMEGSQNEESSLHEKFKRYRGVGEWFEPSADLLSFIKDTPTIYKRDFFARLLPIENNPYQILEEEKRLAMAKERICSYLHQNFLPHIKSCRLSALKKGIHSERLPAFNRAFDELQKEGKIQLAKNPKMWSSTIVSWKE